MLQVNGQGATSAGLTALNNINAAALHATRTKMNSTMMVKFNSSTEKSMNQRGSLNKSTLLPNNVNQVQEGQDRIGNSRNPQMKVTLNIGPDGSNAAILDNNMQQNSLDQLNRSMHQMKLAYQ